MAPLILEGDTLNQKHQHYNKLIKEATKQAQTPYKISDEDNDIENFLKIDIACANKDVEYVLEVLKCEDTLYVSRAIKRISWLITDPQYAHIINPQYLNTQLFPQMTSRAINKLLLYIRLKLKDEKRAEEFYNYYKNNNRKLALKWLARCSVSVIESEVTEQIDYNELSVIKRISKRSITVLEKQVSKSQGLQSNVLQANHFLLNSQADKYVDIINTVPHYEVPKFGARATAKLMKKCPQKVIDNFSKYYNKVDLETFVKHMAKADIKSFLLKYVNNDEMLWFYTYDYLKHFIRHIPAESRYELVKKVYINKEHVEDVLNDDYRLIMVNRKLAQNYYTSGNKYEWYVFAPFSEVFDDLKQIIRTESSPSERNAIVTILLNCAKDDTNNVHSLLQYYYFKHSNEPIKFKIEFINTLLSKTNSQVLDDKIWNLLNKFYHNVGVYGKSENNVQICIQSIIVHKVLHNEKVPEIIENKFAFNSLKKLKLKLNNEEEEKLFSYLYNFLITKINSKNIESESNLTEVVELLENLMTLLLDWKKELANFPLVLKKIKNIVELKQSNTWKTDISCLYNKHKPWRKLLFEGSLVMHPSEVTCINALKYGPELLERYKSEVEELKCNDNISLNHLLNILRVYWPESLAETWKTSYMQRLDSANGQKALVRGICALLPRSELIKILEKYKPTESKINWNEESESSISLSKQFAKKMYQARPPPPLDIVLSYANGDYLQYGLASLSSVLHNMSSLNSHNQISKFLDAPVPLQKHGIRIVFAKLSPAEIKPLFIGVWKSTKNLTIRAVLFKQTFNMLSKQTDSKTIEDMWELLSMFIENLSLEEDRIIYGIMGKFDELPVDIKAKFCMKGYNYLKSLPAKENVESIIADIMMNTRSIMQYLDSDFVANILLDSLENKFTTKNYDLSQTLASYLLCAKSEICQNKRYEKVLVPLLDIAISRWDEIVGGNYFVRNNVKSLLTNLSNRITLYLFELNMVFPTEMFMKIQNKLEEKLLLQNNYLLLRQWSLTITYVKFLQEHKSLIPIVTAGLSAFELNRRDRNRYFQPDMDNTFNEVFIKVAPAFAEHCDKLLKADMQSYFPSIYRMFGKALKNMFSGIDLSHIALFESLKIMFHYNDSIELKLIAIKIIPSNNYYTTYCMKEWKELRKIMCSYPSDIVKMHYYSKYKSYTVDDELDEK